MICCHFGTAFDAREARQSETRGTHEGTPGAADASRRGSSKAPALSRCFRAEPSGEPTDGVGVLQRGRAAVEEGAPQHGLQVAQALVVHDGEGAEALDLLPPLQALLKVLGHLRQGSPETTSHSL